MTKKTILAAATTLFGVLAMTGSASALDLAKIPASNNGDGSYYGIADYRSGQVAMTETSTGMTSPHSASNTGTPTDQFGIVDYLTGAASKPATSQGETGIPAENQLAMESGIVDMRAAARAKNAVVSANGNAIGRVEKIEPNGAYDTLYVRTASTFDTPVSLFRIDVPKSAVRNETVTLNWTVSELLSTLEDQVDMRS